MKKLLIFLDIDGTLIKPNQRPNTKKLPSVIQRLAKKGVIFGLNSNRSFEDIFPVYQQFKLNGPLVLENGVYFLKSLKSRKIFLTKRPRTIRRVSVRAIKTFIEGKKLNCQFCRTDTVKIIKSKRLEMIPFIILLNAFRKYTGSVHIYRYGERDFPLAKRLCLFLKKYFFDNGLDLSVDSPKAFGNVVFWPREASKARALYKIKKFYPEHSFFMISDDLCDLETRRFIKRFFAVANAYHKAKETADYVAAKNYTQGVVEILNYIERNLLK